MKHIIALVFILAGFGSFTQAQESVVSTIPFEFVVGTTTFPAGTYSISESSGPDSAPLSLRSADGKTGALFNPMTTGSTTQNASTKLVFRKEDGKYFLREIVGPFDTYTLSVPKNPPPRAVDPNATISVSTP